MSDPITAGAIATIILTAALGKLAEDLTASAMQNVKTKAVQLRNIIARKLQGKTKAVEILEKGEDVSEADIQKLTAYIEVEMDEDKEFAEKLKTLTQEIHREINNGKIQAQNIMNVSGGNASNISGPNAQVIQGGEGSTFNIN